MGAVMPVKRNAPVKVVVFQWPCGIGDRHRAPRFARPRGRAIFVDAPVSSMNTNRSGSRSGWALNHARRRARKSGRSCRSEEHTSELQSLMRISYAVFCLKKKTHKQTTNRNK